MTREAITINEVGLRDGLQNQPVHVATEDKLRLAGMLVDAGVRHMEATSFVSPKAVPQLADAAELFPRLPAQDRVEYSALIPNEKGFNRALTAGARSVGVVLSATDTMNRENIRMSLDETRKVCNHIVGMARDENIRSRGYVAVAFECPFEGLVSQEVILRLTDELFESGADEVIIADTIGAADPSVVYDRFNAIAQRFDVDCVSAHFHDTRALALANVWAAMQAGVRKFDSSLGGLGGCPFAPGAAGNVATEDLVLMLEQCGYNTGIDIDQLIIAVHEAERVTKRELGGRMLPWWNGRQRDTGSAGSSIAK